MNRHFRKILIISMLVFTELVLFVPVSVYAQISRPGNPMPLKYEGAPQLQIYEIEVLEELKTKDKAAADQSLLKSAKSGALVNVDFSFSNSGVWDTLKDGTKVWRAAFYIRDASMMNIILKPFFLNKGVRVFLYDIQQQYILGAYSDLNNKTINMLATESVPGNTLVVEMQVPAFVVTPGSFVISSIGCDFDSGAKGGTLKDGWYGDSGECNLDINCMTDSVYQTLKHSVVRVVYQGTERCTGTLLNNTKKDGINYVITAEHCISKEEDANTAVFYFDYESLACNGPDGSVQKSISGATIRATSDNLDFTLLELLEPVPFTYHPYYAGWDQSGSLPESGFCIHHPWGDVKKISIENDKLTLASFSGYDANTHYLVNRWETGTTEKGSSGAPFFNSNGRVVGTLTGGLATCENSIKDYFQMFSHSWDDYSGIENQLKAWLNPNGVQAGYLNGYDPYGDFWSSGDTLNNIQHDEQLSEIQGSMEWGSYSGHNSDILTQFAEKFALSETKNILGILLNVADNYVGSTSSELVLTIWNGNEKPESVVYEKKVALADLNENSLNFIEFDSVVTINHTLFAGYSLKYISPQDTFSTYMAENRLSLQQNSAYVSDGIQWTALNDYTSGLIYSSFAVMPVVYNEVPGVEDTSKFDTDVIAYPNPASSDLTLEFRALTESTSYIDIINLQGQVVFHKEPGPYQRRVLLSNLNLSSGIYLLRVKTGGNTHNLKIAILKQ